MGGLRDTALVRCDLCVNGGGVLAAVCGALDCRVVRWLFGCGVVG